MKRSVTTGMILLMLAFSTPVRADVIDRIIATVNDDIITLSDFYTNIPIFIAFNRIPPNAYSTSTTRQQLARAVLQEMINRILLEQQADDHELSVDDSTTDTWIGQMASQNRTTVDQLRQELTTQGIDFDDFREYVRLELTKLRVVSVMVTSGISISDADIDAVVAQRYPDGASEVHYDVSQIMLSPGRDPSEEQREATRQRAEEIRQELLRGGNFEELAAEHSQDATRRDGGHMGEYVRGQLPRDFENQVLNLIPGQLSEIIESRFGFHIVRLNDRWEESTADIDQIREEIHRELQQSRQEREVERFMVGLHAESVVLVNFDPAEIF